MKLRDKTDDEIMQDLSPFGFVDNGMDDPYEALDLPKSGGSWMFEVENDKADHVVNNFKTADFQGRKVRIEIAGERKEDSRNRGDYRGSGGYSGGSKNRTPQKS